MFVGMPTLVSSVGISLHLCSKLTVIESLRHTDIASPESHGVMDPKTGESAIRFN